jgi:uncharacterized membrane protein
MATAEKTRKNKDEDNKYLFGILSYVIFIVALIWYAVDLRLRQDRFMKYHLKQGLALFVAYVLGMFIAKLLSFIDIVGDMVEGAVWVAFLIYVVIGIVHVYHRETRPLPGIGHIAERQLKF